MINDRFRDIQTGYFNISVPYVDVLTRGNVSELVGIRARGETVDGLKSIFMEVEIFKSVIENLLGKNYYYQSTTTVLASRVGNEYVYYTGVPENEVAGSMGLLYNLGF